MIAHRSYLQYLEALATSHVDLRHGEAGKIAYIGTDTTEFDANAANIEGFLLHALPLRGQLSSNGSFGGMRDRVFGGFLILGPINSHAQDFAAHTETFDKAKEIGMDVLQRIQHDLRKGVNSWDDFDANLARYDQTGIYHNAFAGYSFDFPISERCAAQYDESKWL